MDAETIAFISGALISSYVLGWTGGFLMLTFKRVFDLF